MASPSPAAVWDQVESIIRSGSLGQNREGVLIRLLRALVGLNLQGKEVIWKSVAFDLGLAEGASEVDCIEEQQIQDRYRKQLSRLREKLSDYYDGRGFADPIRIELPVSGPTIFHNGDYDGIAHQHYLDAIAISTQRDLESFEKGLELVDRALKRIPGRSDYLGLMSQFHSSLAAYGKFPLREMEIAKDLASRALAAPYPHWRAYVADAVVKEQLEWDWTGAQAAYDQAAALHPQIRSHVWYMGFLFTIGRYREALFNLQERLDDSDLTNPILAVDLGLAQMFSGDLSGALETVRRPQIKGTVNYYLLYVIEAMALEADDRPREALAVIKGMRLRWLDQPVTWGFKALYSGLSGDRKTAIKQLRSLRSLRGPARLVNRYVPATQLAMACIGSAEYDAAIDYLELALRERDPFVLWIRCLPFFRHLRSQKGLGSIIERLKLPPETD